MSFVSLPAWIRWAGSAIGDDEYLECALTLASKLADRLIASFGCDGDGPSPAEAPPAPPARIEDVVEENVVVFIDDLRGRPGADFSPAEVKIQPSRPSLGDFFDVPPPSSREACFALGRILLALFSRGRVPSDGPGPEEKCEDPLRDFLMENLDLGGDDDEISQAPKRPSIARPAARASRWNHANARAVLQERGLPGSVCRLVADLLEADEGNEFLSSTALTSLKEARLDLTRMKEHPQRFLHDCTCPRKACEDTFLFNNSNSELYGRERELRLLIDAAARISHGAIHPSGESLGGSSPAKEISCEAVFLSGHSGSGKSSIIRQLASSCAANSWSALGCKFDRQAAPLSALVQSFDAFFGRLFRERGGEASAEAYGGISRAIADMVDDESLGQLCELLPSLCSFFPMAMDDANVRKASGMLPLGGVGSGSNRLKYLFHLIFDVLRSGGRPVAVILDDLQWSDAVTMDIVGDLIHTFAGGTSVAAEGRAGRRGLLLVGSFRDNEVDEDGFVIRQLKSLEQLENVNATRLHVGELPEDDINNMLSFKFCLPERHTRELAQIVHQKTRGNPFFVIEFLRSIVQRNLISFSIKSRRWIWDDAAIDMQMISEGVLELLKRKLRQLPDDVMEALKVVSCLGFQVNVSTIRLLDGGQFVPDMLKSLDAATREGILERAGPLFQFSHDMLQESTYNLADKRSYLHKTIAKTLARSKIAGDAELCMLAADQMRMCTSIEGDLDAVDRAEFCQINLAAGRHSMSASNFQHARGYFEAGIGLLCSNPWEKQYRLCRELHEMSVAVSFMDGNVETVRQISFWFQKKAGLQNSEKKNI